MRVKRFEDETARAMLLRSSLHSAAASVQAAAAAAAAAAALSGTVYKSPQMKKINKGKTISVTLAHERS